MSSKSRKRKISSKDKNNIAAIIDSLSYIVGRKNLPSEAPGKVLTAAYDKTDAYISAMGINVPKIDVEWNESGAQAAFNKIRRRRKTITRLLIVGAIFGSTLLIAVSIIAILLMEHWAKYVIFGVNVLILFISASYLPKLVFAPLINDFDKRIPEKFKEEYELINSYIQYLIKLRR
ncbi:MAG: hypothetical protein ACTSXA_14320 [Candidatus Heimdallarchaeota archaeon]